METAPIPEENEMLTVSITYGNNSKRHFFKVKKQTENKSNNVDNVSSISIDNDIDGILKNFIRNVTGSANNFVFLRGLTNVFSDHVITNEFMPFLEQVGRKIDTIEGSVADFEISSDALYGNKEIWKDLRSGIRANASLGPMYLLSMTAHYDVLISSIISFFLNKHPGMLDKSDKVFTLSELKNLGSIEEAQQSILEREIDDVMYGSHLSQIEWFDKKMKKSIKEMLRDLPGFCEIFERRNLYAHSSNKVSSRYIKSCLKYGVKEDNIPRIGTALISDAKYIHACSKVLIEYGIIISQVVWRTLYKSEPEKVQLADDMLLANCIMIHKSGQTDLAIFLLELAISRMNPSDDLHKREMIINQAALYLHSGEDKSAEKLINKYDWSASSSRFRFYIHSIRGELDQATELVEICVKERCIDFDEIMESPAFEGLREHPAFGKEIEKIFGSMPAKEEDYKELAMVVEAKELQN